MSSHSDSEIKTGTLKVKRVSFKKEKREIRKIRTYFKTTVRPLLMERDLFNSVLTNNVEKVRVLLREGTNPNSTDEQMRSALHIAASKGYAEIVDLLLRFGANPNKHDCLQNTPLHLAACTTNMRIVTLLINGGADLKSLNQHGRNPLQLAESKLQILRKSWMSEAIEMSHLREQLQEIVDLMITVTRKSKQSTNPVEDVGDLEFLKLSINSGPDEEVDNKMCKILSELQQIRIE